MKPEAVAFRRGKLQGVGVRNTKGIWVEDRCFIIGVLEVRDFQFSGRLPSR
jgi:hypothetical protein